MTENYSAEIYRQNGDPFRSIRLCVCPDGSIKMDAQDKGKLVEEIWGDDDYEFWVNVPVTALPAATTMTKSTPSFKVSLTSELSG